MAKQIKPSMQTITSNYMVSLCLILSEGFGPWQERTSIARPCSNCDLNSVVTKSCSYTCMLLLGAMTHYQVGEKGTVDYTERACRRPVHNICCLDAWCTSLPCGVIDHYAILCPTMLSTLLLPLPQLANRYPNSDETSVMDNLART